ncbi:histidine kinase [Chitinophagaceae bacterium LB-8]|uniref:Histidine kinase n=1 Tax=Paraflavisolibacter caeni TaxID=2982496 RepID=A0A9X2XTB4_9BACT|nr:histidine kinase [Paraflavisolibacter caeni]MCU7548809.1 histidine kinase [Paraflavisolibacter caeni]
MNKRTLLNFLVHWAVWLLLHFITYIPTFVNSSRIVGEYFVYAHLVVSTISFLLFYIVSFLVMPGMAMMHKRWLWVIVTSLLLAILFTFLKFRLDMYWAEHALQKFPQPKYHRKIAHEPIGFFSYRFRTYFQVNILNNVSIIVLAFAYRLALSWYQQEKIRKELENQKLRAELSYLKMQVNPHFLFNALNNIYSLAITEESPKTGDSIMKLANLMRYVLYEKEDNENKVRLDNEIKHINDYIDLEKLRHEEDIYLNFSIEGITYDKRIAPLLLFPLIENAFKHGILTDPKKPVQIEMKVNDQYMDFYILNFKNNYLKDKDGGIGIPNVRKRLDLLYKNSYKLDIKETEDQFFVNLHLPL